MCVNGEDLVLGSSLNDECSSLLDLAFDLPHGGRFLSDFPVWDSKISVPGVRLFKARSENSLKAICGVRLANLRVATHGGASLGSVRVALLGAVCTHPNWRGQGLASGLVAEAVEWARAQGAVAIFLWGEGGGLYERQGFRWCGRQLRTPLSTLLPPLEVDPCLLGRIHLGLTREIFELLVARVDGISLSSADWDWYSSHLNVQWFSLQRAGRPTAYAALGRGLDLQGYIHEWGGHEDDLYPLFRAILCQYPDSVLLTHPDRSFLFGAKDNGFEEYLCMAKVLDPKLLLSSMSGLIQRGSLDCQKVSHFWRFSCGGHSWSVEEENLSRLFFGGPRDGQNNFLESGLEFVVPLRFWFWGLDGA
jgi:GNAT superfamily N-acetyltransferase